MDRTLAEIWWDTCSYAADRYERLEDRNLFLQAERERILGGAVSAARDGPASPQDRS